MGSGSCQFVQFVAENGYGRTCCGKVFTLALWQASHPPSHFPGLFGLGAKGRVVLALYGRKIVQLAF